MVTSTSATERIKLWNQFSTCADHETIKTDFIRRVHRKNPPFRFKLKPKPRFCAEIPPMVEFHYKNPPPLLPSLKDVLRCERVYREHGLPNNFVNGEQELQHQKNLINELDKDLREIRVAHEKVRQFEDNLTEEKEEKVEEVEPDEMSGMNRMGATNGSIGMKPMTEIEMIDSIVENVPMESDEKIIEKIENQSTVPIEPVHSSTTENNLLNSDCTVESTVLDHDDDSNPAAADGDTTKLKSNRKRKRHLSSKCFGSESEELLALSEEVFKSKMITNSTNGALSPSAIDEQLDGLDVNVIKRLALAQLQQILKESPEMVAKCQNDSANKAIKDALKAKPVKMTLPSQLLSKDDIAKIAEQFTNGVEPQPLDSDSDGIDPAYAGVTHPIPPQPQIPTTMAYYHATGFEHIQDDNERAVAIAQRLEKPLRESKIRARAALVPVGDILAGKEWYTNSHQDDSIFMRYRSLTIGTGPGCDLQMKCVRKCARLSPHHATIFYDEVNKISKIVWHRFQIHIIIAGVKSL